MENLKGHSIKGYDLLQLVGSGGFGEVYRAHQAVLEREVAVKIILPHHANDPEFIRNFEAEAHLIARLEHPFIVPLYDFWRDPDGAYLVMRYYPTGNLSQVIRDSGALDFETSARMLEQIGSALDTAHASNIIHRDIKPANILLDTAGNAYLSDFGLAEDIASVKSSDNLVGSPAYVPPEVIQAQSPSHQSDLYSLGFVLFEMLTGRYAFADLSVDSPISSILDFHLHEPIPDALTLSDSVNLVIQRATSKDPLDRYTSGLEMARAFREAIQADSDDESETIFFDDTKYITNPYKGLRAFDEADEYTFFGRDGLIQTLIQRLDEDTQYSNFLALVGASGSGKSSVIHAGLVPAIRRGRLGQMDDWFVLNIVPSSNPFTQLVASIRSISIEPLYSLESDLRNSPDALYNLLDTLLPDDDRLLLVVDQFEELFTQTIDNALQRSFLDMLYNTLKSDRFYLVINLRADFYDRPMMHPSFGQLIQNRTQVVLPPNAQELMAVINKPAEFAGLRVEPELSSAIISDIQAEIVALPLLQYALTEIFDRRKQGRLTLASYQEIGGIAGALAHRADEIYHSLGAASQKITRQLFLRLVTLGEGTEDTRRRIKQSELLSIIEDKAVLQSVLDIFGQARLLTFDNDEASREPTIEVAHEALIREWVLLREWLDVSRDDIRQQRSLHYSAQQWENSEKDTSYLLRGTQLLQIEDWYQKASIQLSQLELDFINDSLAERRRVEVIAEERDAHEVELEKKSQARLRNLLVVFGVSAIFATVLSVFAFNQSNRAREAQNQAIASQNEALTRAEEARSLLLASSAQAVYSQGDTELAIALALDAVNVDMSLLDAPPEIAYDTMLEITHAPGIVYEESVSDLPIERIVISPDNQYAVFGSGQNPSAYFRLGDNSQGQGGNRPPPPDGDRPPPPDGDRPPPPDGDRPPPPGGNTAPPQDGMDFDISVWDIEGRILVDAFIAHQSPITDLAFTVFDSRPMLISASSNGRVIIWDFETRTIDTEFMISDGYLVLSVNEENRSLLVSANNSNQGAARIVMIDLDTQAIVRDYPANPELALARLTHDGQSIVVLDMNGDLKTLASDTGDEIMSTNIRSALRPDTIDFILSPNNQIVGINTDSEDIILFDIVTGQRLGQVVPTAQTHRATFNDDGSELLSISRDGIITVWDMRAQRFVRDFTANPVQMTAVVWDSEADIALMPTNEGALRRYSISGDPVDLVTEIRQGNISQIEWLNDNELIMWSRARRGNIEVWDIENRSVRNISAIESQQGNAEGYFSLNFDKSLVMIVSDTLSIIDIATGDSVDCALCGDNTPFDVNAIFLNDGSNRIFVTGEGRPSLWSLDSDTPLWELTPLGAPVDVLAVSSNSLYIAVALENGDIVVLDSATGDELSRFAYADYVETFVGNNGFTAFNDLVFSPNNSVLGFVSVSSNNVMLLDWQSGTIIQEFIGHDAIGQSLEFLSNGTQLLSASSDTHVILWDINTGLIINEFSHDIVVLDVSLSPDETLIATAPEDSSVHIWRLEEIKLEDAIIWAQENRVVRDLLESECARYDISSSCGGGGGGVIEEE